MASTVTKPKLAKTAAKSTSGRLFFLDLGAGRILSAKPDGSDLKTIVSEGRKLPDGIVVDAEAGHIYWTNMGSLKVNDGSIDRADLDGSKIASIVPIGGTFTPKQLQLDKKNGKLYWCDREGMRVMRCNLDGSKIETLVDTSQGDPRPGPDATKWCVGIALDLEAESSTGRKKDLTMPDRVASSEPIWKSRKGRRRRTATTLNCSTRICPNPSTWIWTLPTARCTGLTAAIRHAATP